MEDLANLDKKLRRLLNRPTEMYGGISIIFAGDFHQIRCNRGTPLYMKHTTHWQGSINCTVMLEGMHRFKDDPEWGEILGRIRSGRVTQADIKKINERFLGLEGVELPPSSEDVCYAVFKNDERNSISAGLFNDLIKSTHPTLLDDAPIPDHTTLIESIIPSNSLPHFFPVSLLE